MKASTAPASVIVLRMTGVCGVVALAGAGGAAHGGVGFYTDLGAWTAAVGGAQVTVEDFSSFQGGGFVPLVEGVNNVGQLQVGLFNGTPTLASIVTDGPNPDLHIDILDPKFTGPDLATISNGQPAFAFAADFSQLGWSAGTDTEHGLVTLWFGDQSVVVDGFLDAAGDGFFGLVSAVPFDEVRFTFELTDPAGAVNDTIELDNIRFAAPIPAPGAWAGGALLLGAAGLRRRR